MKHILIPLIFSTCLYASDESNNEKYSKYQEPPSDLVPTKLDEKAIGELASNHGVTLKVYDNRGLTVAIDGKVVLFIKDHITEIRIKKEEEKKDCTIL